MPGGFVIDLPRWILFSNVVEETLSEVALQFSVKPPSLGMRPIARNVIIVA